METDVATQSIKNRLLDAIKDAMRAGDKERLAVLRAASAAIKQREVDERIDLAENDAAATEVLTKMVKQCRDSAQQYREAGEAARAAAEEKEIEIISEFLPEPASEAEIDSLIDEAIVATGANSMKEMGQVMGKIKPKLQGRADLAAVSARVKSRLSTQTG
ncbi:GatB/YqeY domain-containing protein [Halorhodospira halochloris]|uniref:GatB/YqeY domain-containing protein n=1 Tax=Halorhodospira halochloris TaxID=1052 RepID=UPI003B75B417